jgi:predicted CoA-binding protein
LPAWGVSPNPVRPSHYVARYLGLKGYRVIPVNPGQAGKTLFGETVRADLSEMTGGVDVIDIFRRPEAVPAIVEAALAMSPPPKGDLDADRRDAPEAAARAEAEGLTVIQNRCPKIEYQRLFGSCAWAASPPGSSARNCEPAAAEQGECHQPRQQEGQGERHGRRVGCRDWCCRGRGKGCERDTQRQVHVAKGSQCILPRVCRIGGEGKDRRQK